MSHQPISLGLFICMRPTKELCRGEILNGANSSAIKTFLRFPDAVQLIFSKSQASLETRSDFLKLTFVAGSSNFDSRLKFFSGSSRRKFFLVYFLKKKSIFIKVWMLTRTNKNLLFSSLKKIGGSMKFLIGVKGFILRRCDSRRRWYQFWFHSEKQPSSFYLA